MNNLINCIHPFFPQHCLFRKYDIRGKYALFSNDFVATLASVLVQVYIQTYKDNTKGKNIVIAYDMRNGSFDIAKQIAIAFARNGFDITWLGLTTTPIMAYWAHHKQRLTHSYDDIVNGIMVTASHSEKGTVGIKWIIDGKSPFPKSIQSLYHLMQNTQIQIPSKIQIETEWNKIQNKINYIYDVLLPYQQDINIAIKSLINKTEYPINKIVIDCLNGTTASFAHTLYSQYANEVIVLNDIHDAEFFKGNPDPCEPKRLQELQSAVLYHNANLGLAFDGDGDRIMVIDNKGNIVAPDHLLYLLAKTAINGHYDGNDCSDKKTSPSIIFDVKCSHHLSMMIKSLNAKPIMSKTGSNLMRHQIQKGEDFIIFAGELSGHFIYNDGLFITHDDGMYAGIRLLHWLSSENKSLSEIIEALPSMVSTADTYIDIEERQSILSSFLSIFQKIAKSIKPVNAYLTTIDGIRLDFDNGFGVIRMSNTSQSISVRFAGNTINDLNGIQQEFVRLCQQFDEKLAKAIAKIQPIM